MKVLLGLLVLGVSSVAMARGSHSVSGYVKKDGTYVAPTVATNPNATKLDNYSTKGNVNPYTGKEGTKEPFEPAKPVSPPNRKD